MNPFQHPSVISAAKEMGREGFADFLKKCAIHHRGYLIYTDINGKTRWLDNDEEFKNERPCKACGKFNIPSKNGDSYDACLGKLPGVTFACCGHGSEKGYIVFKNGVRVDLAQIGEGSRVKPPSKM